MAYVITDECVACGTCAEACPAEAISEGDGKYVIDADACLDCGMFCSVPHLKVMLLGYYPSDYVLSLRYLIV